MTSNAKPRLVKQRQDSNKRIIWAVQDVLGLILIVALTYGLGMLAWGAVA